MLYYIHSSFFRILKLKEHFLLFALTLFIQIFDTYAVVRTTGDAILVTGSANNLSGPLLNKDIIDLNGGHNLTTGSALDLSRIDINGHRGQTFTIHHMVQYDVANDLDMELHVEDNGSITIQDTAESAYVNKGTLMVRTVKGGLRVTDGNAVVHDVDGNVTLDNHAVVTQTGTVGNDLDVSGDALYTGSANVTGSVVMNTNNCNTNELRDIRGPRASIINGIVVMRNINMGDLLAQGGVSTVRNVGQDVILTNDAVVNQEGTVGRTLNVGGTALFKGQKDATDVVTGDVIIHTARGNSLHDVLVGAVTVTQGHLTMNDVIDAATGDITVDGLASSVSVNNIGHNAIVKNNGVLSVRGNIGGTLNNDTASVATVNLTGAGTVTGVVGGTNAITKITVKADRIFTAAGFGLTELNFANDAKVSLTNLGANLAGANVTLDKDGVHHIEVQGAQNITGEINKDNKAGLDIKVMGNIPVAVDIYTPNFNADLLADKADTVTVTLGNAFVSSRKLGSKDARFLLTTFDNNAEVTVGDIYSKDKTVNAGKKVKFTGKVVGENLNLANADSGVKFADGATLASKIVAQTPGEGLVEFEGGLTLEEDIGTGAANVKSVKFSGPAPILASGDLSTAAKLNKDISTIDSGNTLLAATSNSTLHGETTATYVGAKSGQALTFADGPLKLVGDIGIVTQVTESAGALTSGKVVADNSAVLNLTALKSTSVFIDDSTIGTPTNGHQFTVFHNATGGLTGAFQSISVTNKSSLVKWNAAADTNGNIVLTQRNDALSVLTTALGPNANVADLSNMETLANSPNNFKELSNMETPEAQADMIRRAPTNSHHIVFFSTQKL